MKENKMILKINRVKKELGTLDKKIYEVDPMTCDKYGGTMKILSFIEDREIIKKILKHGGSDNLSRASRSNEWLYIDPKYLSDKQKKEGSGLHSSRTFI